MTFKSPFTASFTHPNFSLAPPCFLWTVQCFTERGKHRGVGVDADERQRGNSATDSYSTSAGEGTSRREIEAETTREKSPASTATVKRDHKPKPKYANISADSSSIRHLCVHYMLYVSVFLTPMHNIFRYAYSRVSSLSPLLNSFESYLQDRNLTS